MFILKTILEYHRALHNFEAWFLQFLEHEACGDYDENIVLRSQNYLFVSYFGIFLSSGPSEAILKYQIDHNNSEARKNHIGRIKFCSTGNTYTGGSFQSKRHERLHRVFVVLSVYRLYNDAKKAPKLRIQTLYFCSCWQICLFCNER